MAAPVKPWERPGINFQQNNGTFPSNSMSAGLSGGVDSIQRATLASPSPAVATPPQLPPRPSEQSSFTNRMGSGLGYNSNNYGGYSGLGGSSYGGSYGGMGGGYSSMGGGYSSMGGYGSSYGGMGGYSSGYGSGYGYNRMGAGGEMNSSFARHAEESSRPAFESIESIVSAVNSVGMMLDSTFQAVYNSFRAVIGVADNFSRLKSQLVQVFSALAFIRTLRYMLRRLLELLRLRPPGEADKQWLDAFNHAAASAATGGPGGGPKKSSWPIMVFFGIIMGGPYLIWRLISAFSNAEEEVSTQGWTTGRDDHFVARSNHDFDGKQGDELAFRQGVTLYVAPKELQPQVRGWLLASDGSKSGMVPANYVTVLGRRKGTGAQHGTPAPLAGEPLPAPLAGEPLPAPTPNTDLNQAYTSVTSPPKLSPSSSEFDSMFDSQAQPSASANSLSQRDMSDFDQSFTNLAPGSMSHQDTSEILKDLDPVR